MPYQAPLELMQKIMQLRQRYEKETNCLLTGSSPYAISKFFGAHDIALRNKQISTLESFAKLKNPFESEEPLATLQKYRLLVGLSLVIQKQIEQSYSSYHASYGTLHTLINELLAIDKSNQLDDETIYECLLAVKKVSLDSINAKKWFVTAKDWQAIQDLADKQLGLLKETRDYPLSQALGKIGRYAFRPLGYGVGYVLFETIGGSTVTAPIKLAIASTLGYCLIGIAGPLTSAGVGAIYLLAHQKAEKAVSISCGIAGAMIVGKACGFVGEKLGQGTGFTLDLGYLASSALVHHLKTLIAHTKENQQEIGLSLIDGMLFIKHQKGKSISLESIINSLPKERHSEEQLVTTEALSCQQKSQIEVFLSLLSNPQHLNATPTSIEENEGNTLVTSSP